MSEEKKQQQQDDYAVMEQVARFFQHQLRQNGNSKKAIVDGLKSGIGSDPEGAICLIKFLAFVGVSGFYVLYRYFTFTINSEAGDMFALYGLYNFIGLFHTYIYCTMICD